MLINVKRDKCKGFHHMFPPYTPSAAAALQKFYPSFLYKKVKRINNNNNRATTPIFTWWKNVGENMGERKGGKKKM
ncbi:MAG: hypothetical protein ACO2PM_26135 [Pyrobaculum sp.]